MAEEDFNPGDVVFAKVKGYPPWPARINPMPEGVNGKGKYNVFFYGTYEHAFVVKKDIHPYEPNKEKLGKPQKRRGFKEALYEIEHKRLVLYPGHESSDDESSEEEDESSDEDDAVQFQEEPKRAKIQAKPAVTKRAFQGVAKRKRVSEPFADMNNNEITDICEIEEIRKLNVEDNKAVLARLMKDLKEMAPLPPLKKPCAPKRRESAPGDLNKRRRSLIRFNPNARRPVTRARTKKDDGDSDEENAAPHGKLKLYGGLFKPRSREMALAQEANESDGEYYEPRRRSVNTLPHVVKSPDDITEEDLAMVADKGIVKKYDPVYGTTCHQCRQKTLDVKTVCRNEECVGVRGQFCGVCLINRYGEDARKALKDPDWHCPPCRRICNCSICRTRNGKFATGILVHLANEHGYSNVHDYLVSLRKEAQVETQEESEVEAQVESEVETDE